MRILRLYQLYCTYFFKKVKSYACVQIQSVLSCHTKKSRAAAQNGSPVSNPYTKKIGA